MQRIFERKFTNINNLLAQLECHFNIINSLVKNENKKEGEKCTSDSVWISLQIINTLMEKFMSCINHYRLVKPDLSDEKQKDYSAQIKKFAGSIEKTRHLITTSTRIESKGTIEFFIKKLNTIAEKIEFSWKAALPYEPPKLMENDNATPKSR